MTILILASFILAQVPAAPPNPIADYVVGPGDALNITVLREPELTGRFPIAADGTFDYPWIGRVKASGRTVRSLEEEIAKRLLDGKYLLGTPQITIQIQEFRSQYVYVQGEVQDQGMHALTGLTTLQELLGKVVVKGSAGEEILVYRRKGPERQVTGPIQDARDPNIEVIRVKKTDLLSGRAATIVLQHEDTITVPKAPSVFISGEVKAPAAYVLDGELNVLQVITLAGGPTERGDINKTDRLTIVDGKQKWTRVKLTDPVRPGDTFRVGRKWF
jgi:polysaccharide biosynthesis/export protein